MNDLQLRSAGAENTKGVLYLQFRIREQRFALSVHEVVEVLPRQPLKPIAQAPAWVAGILAHRGQLVPVIDLAARLGWTHTDATPRNPIIVIEYEGRICGLIVHDVADIVSIEAGTLQQPDAMGHETITHFLEGIAPLGDDMVMVLDLKQLMTEDLLELEV